MSSFFEYFDWLKNFHFWCFVASLQAYWLALSFKLCMFKSIVTFHALICEFDLSLKHVDEILNDDIFIESYMLCKQIAVMKFNNILWNFLRSSSYEYTIHALLSNSLLWNSRKINSFQFHWTRTIVYRVICDEMLVEDFWFMLACLSFVKQFLIVLAC